VQHGASGPPVFNFHGDFSGILNIAGRDVRGRHKAEVENTRHANEGEVVKALETILALQEVPWSSPALAGVESVVRDAVNRHDLSRPGLRSAVRKLLKVCEELAVGVAGNYAFTLLQGYFK
jgi:hypothetical protein